MSPKATDLDKTGLEDHGEVDTSSNLSTKSSSSSINKPKPKKQTIWKKAINKIVKKPIYKHHSTDRGKLGIDSGIVSRSSQTKNGIPDLFLKRNQQKVVLSVLERARERDCVQQDECRGRRSVDFRTSTQSREGIAEENQTQQCV
ncbi:hypothetical protein TNCV_5087321 [Trichonephila clavipes]|nr:hypothetical protein TNCV_5087321 [Trichonephila clavipes]